MRKYKYETIDWSLIQKDYDDHKDLTLSHILKKYNLSMKCLDTARKKGLFKSDDSRKFHHHTEDTKKILSQKRKEYLKNNPDKHPWKKFSKFKSVPCEKLKQALKEQNLDFIEEFSDITWEHNYSIDIAFPHKKIAIEVNGNQHYNNDGTLKEYYIQREKYLKSLGWIIYQLHYSLIYNQEFVLDLINKIKNNIHLITENFKFYIKQSNNAKNDKKHQQEINKQKLIEKRKQIIMNSNIDFSKFGWAGKISKLFGNERGGSRWIKKYLPEFYEQKCFKRKQFKTA